MNFGHDGSSINNQSNINEKNPVKGIAYLLRQLISINVPRDANVDQKQYEQRINKFLRLLMLIVSSNMGKSQSQDPLLLSETIKKNLIRESRTQDVMKFSDLYRRFTEKRLIHNHSQFISLLHIISSERQNLTTLETLTLSDMSFDDNNDIDIANNAMPSKVMQNGSVHVPSESAFDLFHKYENTTFEVGEQDLLMDVIYAFQGIDGRYVKYDPLAETYQVDSRVGVSRSTRDLVRNLCELGWIYKRIRDFVQNIGGFGGGLVLQAFSATIEHELSHYYKLIAILEQQLVNQSIHLRRLIVWSTEPLERLKLMLILIDLASSKKGAALVSELYNLSKHGDPFVSKFVRDVLVRTCTPIFAFIKSWMIEGVLEDPFNEFWVISDENVKIDELWKSKYSLGKEMVPSFVDIQLAEEILTIGRTINFIRRCCEDTEWQMDSNTIALASENLTYDNLYMLEKSVSNAAKAANKRVMELLFDKYRLHAHFTALKQYMLLGKGDFIQHLLELIGADLNKPGHSIIRLNLLGALDAAIRNSNTEYNPDIHGRLDIRLSSEGQIAAKTIQQQQQQQQAPLQNDIGWDMFSLDYRVTPPLDTIFTKDVLRVYVRIFKHLWRIKRVDSMLDTTWMKHQELARSIAKSKRNDASKKFTSILHKCNLLRNEMVHFCNNLQYYFMFEVIENQWQTLVDKIDKLQEGGNGDLKALIEAHENFVKDIVRQALLSNRQSDLKEQLARTVEVIMQFVNMQDIVYSETITVIMKNDRMEEDEDYNMESSNQPDFNAERFAQKLDDIRRSFKDKQREFLVMLKSPTLKADSMLQHLAHRLDFMLNNTGNEE